MVVHPAVQQTLLLAAIANTELQTAECQCQYSCEALLLARVQQRPQEKRGAYAMPLAQSLAVFHVL